MGTSPQNPGISGGSISCPGIRFPPKGMQVVCGTGPGTHDALGCPWLGLFKKNSFLFVFLDLTAM